MFSSRTRRPIVLFGAFLSFFVVLLFSAMPAWTAETTGTATARIIQPLSIESFNGNDTISFGKIVPDTSNPGTVEVKPLGTGWPMGSTRILHNVTALEANDYGIALFTIQGETGEAVKVDTTTTAQLHGDQGGDMTVQITSSVPSSPFALPAGGALLGVGGTLSVAANQPAGNYSGTIDVTVSY